MGERQSYLLRPWDVNSNNFSFTKGRGAYLYDVSGNKYINFTSGAFNVNFGYSKNSIIKSIIRQLRTLPYLHIYFSTNIREELARKLVEMNNFNFSKAYICCGGGEAVEAAMRFAKHYSKNNKFISLKGSYHGSSENASQLSYDPDSSNIKRDDNIFYVDGPYCYRCPFALQRHSCNFLCVTRIKKVIYENRKQIAALFIEPVIGINAFVFLPKSFLQEIRNICTENNILLIFDEVLTGFYRTGTMFAYQYADVVPDILCLGKGMNSGYVPIGAVLISEKVYEFFEDHPLEYGTTNMAHTLSCASATTTLKCLEKLYIRRQLTEKENSLANLCNQLGAKYPALIGEVRGRGLLYALELVKNKEKTRFSEKEMLCLVGLLLKNNILIDLDPTKSILPLAPPFILSKREIAKTMRTIDSCLHKFQLIMSNPSVFSFRER